LFYYYREVVLLVVVVWFSVLVGRMLVKGVTADWVQVDGYEIV